MMWCCSVISNIFHFAVDLFILANHPNLDYEFHPTRNIQNSTFGMNMDEQIKIYLASHNYHVQGNENYEVFLNVT